MTMSNRSEADVYMSGPLTVVEEKIFAWLTKEVYDRVLGICESVGLSCYCPHRSKTTPTKGITHNKVWKIDYKRVVNSGAVVAYIGIPALGVGAEIEMARSASVPVILICDSERQEGLSRLILGNPAVKDCLIFDHPDDLEDELRRSLYSIFSEKNLQVVAEEEGWSLRDYNQLKSILAQEIAADKFRHQSFAPIVEEEWRDLKGQLGRRSQRGLFDD